MPSTVDVEHRLRCAYPRGCTYEPRPGYRHCLVHADTEPVTRDVTECEFPEDLDRQHDHYACEAKKQQRGVPGGTCVRVDCWLTAGPSGRCAYHDTTREFIR